MRMPKSLSIHVGPRLALTAAALLSVTPVFAQSTENLIVAFSGGSQAVPLSPWLTVATGIGLAAVAYVILRRRGARGGRLFGWLLALAAATLAGVGERAISKAQAALPPAVINLSSSPGTLNLLTYWNSNIDPLTVTVTNTTSQSVRITSVTTDNMTLYILSKGTTCVVGNVLAPNAQCTVMLSIQ